MLTRRKRAPTPIKASNAKQFFASYVQSHRWTLSGAIALTFLLAAVSAPIPILLGPALQVIADPLAPALRIQDLFGPIAGPWLEQALGLDTVSAAALLNLLPIALASSALLKAVIGGAQWYLFELLGEEIARAMRSDLMQAYLYLDPMVRRQDTTRSQEASLSSAIGNDIRMVREFFVHYYGGLPREFLQTMMLTVWLYILSPKLFLIFLLGIAPLGIILSRVGKKLRKRAQRALQDYSQLSEWLQQRLLGIETIKHYGSELLETQKMNHLNNELRHRFLRAARVKARTSPMIEALAAIACAVVLIIALKDVASGAASGAAQLSFFSTIGILSQSASKLGRYLNANREGVAALRRLLTIKNDLDSAKLKNLELNIQLAKQPRIVCENVSVRYSNSNSDALSEFSFVFDPGKLYCLVGPSGAGKSTLFNLLLGLIRPSSGKLIFAMQHQQNHVLQISYMPQKVQLMPGSIAENIIYPDQNPNASSMPRIAESLNKVGLNELINSLPLGINEIVGEAGRGLSGGQAQRILLARLWYHQTPFILVDEGTSALDPETEQLIFGLLNDLAAKGAIIIMIAHRMAAASIADEILLLDQGKLIIHGKKESVMSSDAFKSVFC